MIVYLENPKENFLKATKINNELLLAQSQISIVFFTY